MPRFHTLLLTASSAISLCLPVCTYAHMQASGQPAAVAGLGDATDDFACREYGDANSKPTRAVYQAGQVYDTAALAREGGGGGGGGGGGDGGGGGGLGWCQIALSYDHGASFKTIHFQTGACSAFTVPSFAPAAGSALLSWTWFDWQAGREAPPTCARVSIRSADEEDGDHDLHQPIPRYRGRQRHRQPADLALAARRQALWDSLPDLLVSRRPTAGAAKVKRAELVAPDDDVAYGRTGNASRGLRLGPASSLSSSSSSSSPWSPWTYAGARTTTVAESPSTFRTTIAPTAAAHYPNTTTTTTTLSTSSRLETPAAAAGGANATKTETETPPTATRAPLTLALTTGSSAPSQALVNITGAAASDNGRSNSSAAAAAAAALVVDVAVAVDVVDVDVDVGVVAAAAPFANGTSRATRLPAPPSTSPSPILTRILPSR